MRCSHYVSFLLIAFAAAACKGAVTEPAPAAAPATEPAPSNGKNVASTDSGATTAGTNSGAANSGSGGEAPGTDLAVDAMVPMGLIDENAIAQILSNTPQSFANGATASDRPPALATPSQALHFEAAHNAFELG